MDERKRLAQQFEEQRPRLRAVAYRMLGSLTEAEDAVQETWIRLSRTDSSQIESLSPWLTTVIARVSLNMLRSRTVRARTPDPILDPADGASPEHAALIADSVGIALLVVLETLSPPERVAFVLHDIFDLPFDEIGRIVERSPDAARQLASRARRRVRQRNTTPEPDLEVQKSVVNAFLAAAQDGDFQRLVAVLDQEVVLRSDTSASGDPIEISGAERVARGASSFSNMGIVRHPVLVNGAAGALCLLDDKPIALMAFTVRHDKIVEIDIVRDPERVARLDLSAVEPVSAVRN